jgi:hypothetical protein
MSHSVLASVPRLPGFRRGVRAPALPLIAVGASLLFAGPAQGAGPRIPASQPLVELLENHTARTQPDADARRIEAVAARRPLTRVRTVLPLLRSVTTTEGVRWVKVRLPGRPSGHTGWILADRTRSTSTGWHLSVALSARRVTVFRDGRAVRRFSAVIGTAFTPTPRGRFFVEEAVALSAADAGGPYALATSARSDVLQEFNGGPGQIAIHGTGNLFDPLGSAASHGCVRLGTTAITWLARRVGSGVPITIKR